MGGLLCRASSPEPLVQAAKTALWVQLFAELACAVLAVVWVARWPNRRERGGLAQAAASLVASTTAFSVAVCGRSLSAARPSGARPAAACAALAVVTGSVAAAALREARAGQGDRATGTLLRIALLLQLGLLLARATCCDILAKLDDPPERVFSDFAAVEVAPRREAAAARGRRGVRHLPPARLRRGRAAPLRARVPRRVHRGVAPDGGPGVPHLPHGRVERRLAAGERRLGARSMEASVSPQALHKVGRGGRLPLPRQRRPDNL